MSGATVAYALTADNGATSEVVCTRMVCAQSDRSGDEYAGAVPLDQSDIEEMARHDGAPVACDRCGVVLAEVTPEPADVTILNAAALAARKRRARS